MRGRIHALKFLVLDAPSLAIFKWVTKPKLGRQSAPAPSLTVVDVNEVELQRFISEVQPDFILNYGTSLYTEEALRQLARPIINIHDGIIPTFRNVHTDFWAYFLPGDLPLGVTLFEIDNRIDAGRIVKQQTVSVKNPKTFRECRRELADLRVALATSVVHGARNGTGCDQMNGGNVGSEGSWPRRPLWANPTFGDVMRVLARRELVPRFVRGRCL